MSASASPPIPGADIASRAYSLVQASTILGVDRNTLSKWLDQGCPYQKRADRSRGVEWEIVIKDVVSWRITRSVEEAISGYQDDNGNVSKDEADRRRAVANAITAEISADDALDAVVRRHDAEADVASFCLVLKTGLSNACSRIASRAASIGNAPEIEELCQVELNRAFDTARADLEQRWSGDREMADDDSRED